MEIMHTLSDSEKLILTILRASDGIMYVTLRTLHDFLEAGDSSVNKIAAHLEEINKPYIPIDPKVVLESRLQSVVFPSLTKSTSSLLDDYGRKYHPSSFEKRLTGLEYVGLVRIEEHEKSNKLDHCKIFLTDYGGAIADKINDNRKIILRSYAKIRNTVFVACAFGHDDVDLLYTQYLEHACNELGYNAFRVDLSEPRQTITEEIMSGIISAECVIADLSYARPSVYFEVGFAHGLGVPLLLTCRHDHYRSTIDQTRVHFDLEQFKISFWEVGKKGVLKWPVSMSPKVRLKTILNQDDDVVD